MVLQQRGQEQGGDGRKEGRGKKQAAGKRRPSLEKGQNERQGRGGWEAHGQTDKKIKKQLESGENREGWGKAWMGVDEGLRGREKERHTPPERLEELGGV